MKNALLFIAILLSTGIYAQPPQAVSYQSVIRNMDGSVMSNSPINVLFRVHDLDSNGPVVYEESHQTSSNALGLINLNLGTGLVSIGNFSQIAWQTGRKFLQVLVDFNSSLVDIGSQEILSVPYALFSGDVPVSVSSVGDTLTIGTTSVIVPGISGNSGNGNFTQGEGVTDIDGNFYESVIIGDQEWMASNLAVKRYNNGTTFNQLTNNLGSGSYLIPYWAYPNDYGGFNPEFGKLYTKGVVYQLSTQNRNICPIGWHIPSSAEWDTLITNVQNFNNIRKPGLVSNGTGHWVGSEFVDDEVTNSFGFNAVAAGNVRFDPYGTSFQNFGEIAGYWSRTPINTASPQSQYYILNSGSQSCGNGTLFCITASSTLTSTGYSIRCLKDN